MTASSLKRAIVVTAMLGLSACSGTTATDDPAGTSPTQGQTQGTTSDTSSPTATASHSANGQEDTTKAEGTDSADESFNRPFIVKLVAFPEANTFVFTDDRGTSQLKDGKITLVNTDYNVLAMNAKDGVLYGSGFKATEPKYREPVGMLRSSDMGKTWEEVPSSGMDFAVQMAITKQGMVGFDGLLYRSEDEGKNWKPVADNQEELQLSSIAGFPTTNSMIAATLSGLKLSDDAGTTWHNPKNTPVLFFVEFASADVAYGVGVDNQFYRTEDRGVTWKAMSHSPNEVLSFVTTDPQHPDYVATGNADWLYESRDAGVTWASTDLTTVEEDLSLAKRSTKHAPKRSTNTDTTK